MGDYKTPNNAIFIATLLFVAAGMPPIGIDRIIFYDSWERIDFDDTRLTLAAMTIIILAMILSYVYWEKGGKFILLAIFAFGVMNWVGCAQIIHEMRKING
jgi:hypothetical protein